MGSKIFEFTEPVKEIETDILVAGAGPGGTCAAIAAARSGAKVLLVEQGNCAGGMVTQGLVGPFMTCYDKSGEHMIIRGLFEEVVDRMIEKAVRFILLRYERRRRTLLGLKRDMIM